MKIIRGLLIAFLIFGIIFFVGYLRFVAGVVA